jgi:hypothetical protein
MSSGNLWFPFFPKNESGELRVNDRKTINEFCVSPGNRMEMEDIPLKYKSYRTAGRRHKKSLGEEKCLDKEA